MPEESKTPAPPATPPAPPQQSAAPNSRPDLPPPPEHFAPAPDPSGTTRNPNGWAPGAYETFSETRKALAEANTAVARIAAELESTRLAAERAQAEVAAQAARHEQEMALRDLGGNFRAASVQRMVRQEYAAYRADAGTAAQSFTAWLASEPVRTDPLFAAHFGSTVQPGGSPTTSAAPAAHQGTAAPAQQPPQPPFNPAAGQKAVGAGGAVVHEWTDSRIAEYATSPGRWRENREEVRRALEERLGVSLAPSTRKPPPG